LTEISPCVYSRFQIIEAAYELVREKGWDAVSTRAIAKQLGSSTMPIYSHVKSVEELEKELHKKARSLLRHYQQKEYTRHTLLNLAFGYVTFARDEKNLFRFLYLDRPDKVDLEDISTMKKWFFEEFGERGDEAVALLKLGTAGQEDLLRYTWIFTHGLAVMVNSGVLGRYTDRVILELLRNAGEAFYMWSVEKGGEGFESEK